jgi:hypothetical protein
MLSEVIQPSPEYRSLATPAAKSTQAMTTHAMRTGQV